MRLCSFSSVLRLTWIKCENIATSRCVEIAVYLCGEWNNHVCACFTDPSEMAAGRVRHLLSKTSAEDPVHHLLIRSLQKNPWQVEMSTYMDPPPENVSHRADMLHVHSVAAEITVWVWLMLKIILGIDLQRQLCAWVRSQFLPNLWWG